MERRGKVKVFHGPHNTGGMAGVLARAQRECGVQALAYCHSSNRYQFECDRVIQGTSEAQCLAEMAQFFREEGSAYDVFQFYFGSSLAGPDLLDVPFLKRRGKTVCFYFCGCDIRDADVTIAKYEVSACKNCLPRKCNPNRSLAQEIASRHADLIFVSTPDLLEFVPGSILMPQPMDLARFSRLREQCTHGRSARRRSGTITIAHAPSARIIKGTSYIVTAVKQLRQQGYPIELRLVEGVSHAEALRQCATADLVIDQLLVGSYGQFAVEMMALGKPVVCYIRSDLQGRYPAGLPIVAADPQTLPRILADLLDRPQEWTELGRRGMEYVNQVHGSQVIARQMIQHYQEAARRKPEMQRTLSRRIVMVSSDGHPMDRRIIQEARTLADIGHQVVLIGGAAEGCPDQEWIDFGIELIRYPPSAPRAGLPHWKDRLRPHVPGWLRRPLKWLIDRTSSASMVGLAIRKLRPGWKLLAAAAESARLRWFRRKGPTRLAEAKRPEPTPPMDPLVSLIASLRPQCIHAHDLPHLEPSLQAAQLCGARVIYDAHEWYPQQSEITPLQRESLTNLEQRLIKQAAAVITVNPFLARLMSQAYDVQIETILNAIDSPANLLDEKHDRIRRALQLPPDQKLILYQGWLVANGRNLESLIQAMKQVNDGITLILMGYGEADKLATLAANLGLSQRVRFVPAKDQSELLFWTASADVGIIPYGKADINTTYASPNKLYEFIQAGLPILAPNLPYIRSVVEGEAIGLVRDLHDPESFARAIAEIFSDPARLQQFRTRMQAVRARYSWKAQETSLLAIYDRTMGRTAA